MSVIDIGAAEDFPDRTLRQVRAAGLEVAVCRWGAELFAVRGRCPHQAAPLSEGFLQVALSSRFTPDGVEVDADAAEPAVLCPWHRWEFSLRSGESACPGYRVATYPVHEHDGRVLIRVGRG
ncbi:MAG TPA: Rieske 2Fe-2S domain-containing protein [Pseudonocardia sp.]|uniref:Rieske (2Fe-2S) protein n=1 Tax=Pseudonocardia sp. TaxID=60912 RepID=UPI002B4B7F76|nr:Rieske 2Fe-2S domain-containing protein [Pseudonocardia sp.]HLU54615.1 Rieske 2Fe-2S domain-containing protein [Pseudonocardia sp.]